MTQITTGAHPETITVRLNPWRWATRWVIIDLHGAAREHLATREAVREVLLEAERDHPGIAAEVYVVAYDQNGNPFGDPQRGDELLAGGGLA